MIIEFCKRTGFTFEDILGEAKRRPLRQVRGVYMVILKKNGYSLNKICLLTNKSIKTVSDSINDTIRQLDRKNPFVLDLYSRVKDLSKIEAKNYRNIVTEYCDL